MVKRRGPDNSPDLSQSGAEDFQTSQFQSLGAYNIAPNVPRPQLLNRIENGVGDSAGLIVEDSFGIESSGPSLLNRIGPDSNLNRLQDRISSPLPPLTASAASTRSRRDEGISLSSRLSSKHPAAVLVDIQPDFVPYTTSATSTTAPPRAGAGKQPSQKISSSMSRPINTINLPPKRALAVGDQAAEVLNATLGYPPSQRSSISVSGTSTPFSGQNHDEKNDNASAGNLSLSIVKGNQVGTHNGATNVGLHASTVDPIASTPPDGVATHSKSHSAIARLSREKEELSRQIAEERKRMKDEAERRQRERVERAERLKEIEKALDEHRIRIARKEDQLEEIRKNLEADRAMVIEYEELKAILESRDSLEKDDKATSLPVSQSTCTQAQIQAHSTNNTDGALQHAPMRMVLPKEVASNYIPITANGIEMPKVNVPAVPSGDNGQILISNGEDIKFKAIQSANNTPPLSHVHTLTAPLPAKVEEFGESLPTLVKDELQPSPTNLSGSSRPVLPAKLAAINFNWPTGPVAKLHQLNGNALTIHRKNQVTELSETLGVPPNLSSTSASVQVATHPAKEIKKASTQTQRQEPPFFATPLSNTLAPLNGTDNASFGVLASGLTRSAGQSIEPAQPANSVISDAVIEHKANLSPLKVDERMTLSLPAPVSSSSFVRPLGVANPTEHLDRHKDSGRSVECERCCSKGHSVEQCNDPMVCGNCGKRNSHLTKECWTKPERLRYRNTKRRWTPSPDRERHLIFTKRPRAAELDATISTTIPFRGLPTPAFMPACSPRARTPPGPSPRELQALQVPNMHSYEQSCRPLASDRGRPSFVTNSVPKVRHTPSWSPGRYRGRRHAPSPRYSPQSPRYVPGTPPYTPPNASATGFHPTARSRSRSWSPRRSLSPHRKYSPPPRRGSYRFNDSSYRRHASGFETRQPGGSISRGRERLREFRLNGPKMSLQERMNIPDNN